MVLCPPDSWLNCNLEILVFEERGKPEYLPGEKERTNNKVSLKSDLLDYSARSSKV